VGAENLLLFRFSDLANSSRRLVLNAAHNATGYGKNGPSRDDYLRGGGSCYWSLSDRVYLDTGVSHTRFRRAAVPSSDVDRTTIGARFARRLGGLWRVGAGIEHAWLSFPGRVVSDDPETMASDRRLDLLFSLRREVLRAGYLRAELGYRRTVSNDDLFAHRGPLAILYWGSGTLGNTELSANVTYRQRSYPDYSNDTGRSRDDETWRFGVGLDQNVSPRAVIFLRTYLTHQTSNVDGVGYDREYLTAGLRISLWSRTLEPRTVSVVPTSGFGDDAAPAKLTPEALQHGICFRCRAPEAASVSVVGLFNGWDPVRGTMQDVDRDGIWETVVPVDPGEWRYAFVVDGKWVRPKDAERYEPDPYDPQLWNGILEVVEERTPGAGDQEFVTPNPRSRPTEWIEG